MRFDLSNGIEEVRIILGYEFVTDLPGTKEFQIGLEFYLTALALGFREHRVSEYATMSGIPVRFQIEFPFNTSTESGSFAFVHVLTKCGIDPAVEANFSVHLPYTIVRQIVSLESVITEPLIVNAVRKFIDMEQVVLYPEGKHPSQLQVVAIQPADYDYKTKRFTYVKATDEQIRDFLKRKVYWLGFRRGIQSTRVCIADPYDAAYLNVSSERLQQDAAILAAEGVLQIDSSGLYANAGTRLLQEALRLDHELAVFLGAEPSRGEKVVSLSSRTSATVESPLFDVFISHATEDKPYVEPLVKALEAAGVSVWFDKITLEWGDDLRASIDRGLANCRYGIVVFSKAFLRKKKWTEYELNSLFALEQPGKKIILPIWHDITRDDLLQYSAGFADRLAKVSSKDSHEDIVESLLGLLGRSKPQKSNVAGGTASVVTEPDQKGNVTEFTLEAFYFNHAPDRQTFACQSVSETPGRYVYDTSADGTIMRSEIEPPAVLVKGVDLKTIESLGWKPTHLRFKDGKTGEEKVFPGQLRDTLEPDTLKFAIRGSDAMAGTRPMAQTPAVAEPVQAKPNAIAYAWYETTGENALKAKASIRPSIQREGWFTFENSFGEEQHGTKEEIALRLATFDRSLRLKRYVRTHDMSSDPAFKLG